MIISIQILPIIGYIEIIGFHNWDVNSKNPYQEYVDNKGPKSYQFESLQKIKNNSTQKKFLSGVHWQESPITLIN